MRFKRRKPCSYPGGRIDGFASAMHAAWWSGWLIMTVGSPRSRVRLVSRLVVPLALMVALVLGAPVGLVLAQIDPQVRDRVVPAVVEIAIILHVTENGTTEPQFLPVGS